MEVLVSPRTFGDKHKKYLDIAAAGTRVVLRRGACGKKQSFAIVPIDDDDSYFTDDVLQRLDLSIRQVQEGKTVKLTPELRNELFGKR
ncbi:hypothetical protein FACS1894156_8830 [Bacteroidia bacterium]|nr:hypothetical protein FACS1894156_8830 [Bacteroidia bacterium]